MRALAMLIALTASAAAAPRLDLRIEGDHVEATVVEAPKAELVFLRDVASGRRIPAIDVREVPPAWIARFELALLPHDGKPHELALDIGDGELARATLVLPSEQSTSSLRWLVIVGPLLGLLMIGLAVYIGRRVKVRSVPGR